MGLILGLIIELNHFSSKIKKRKGRLFNKLHYWYCVYYYDTPPTATQLVFVNVKENMVYYISFKI